MKNNAVHGYTLLEMSIVLVIIGVIVGAVMFGKALVTTSRLQTVITDADSYTSAVVNFKQTYQALPGDFTGARALWGTDSSGCPSGDGATGTCNGNGDGQILKYTSSGTYYEEFRFWQHLYYAGMFSKVLSGVVGPAGTYDAVIGTNVPAGSIKGSGFSVIWFGTITGSSTGYCTSADCYDTTPTGNATTGLFYGNVLLFGGQSSGNLTYAPILTPDQAASIDAKVDDGFPSTGKVMSYIYNSATFNPGGCTTNASPALYNVSNTSPLCSLIFVPGF